MLSLWLCRGSGEVPTTIALLVASRGVWSRHIQVTVTQFTTDMEHHIPLPALHMNHDLRHWHPVACSLHLAIASKSALAGQDMQEVKSGFLPVS